jgi:hypothetical protein
MSSISIPSFVAASKAAEAPWRARLASLHKLWRLDFFGIRGLSLSRLGWAFLFVAVFATWSTLGNLLGIGLPGFCAGGAVDCFLIWVPQYSLWILPQVLAFTLTDNLPLRDVPRFVALGVAAVLAAFGSVLLTCTVAPVPEFVSRCRDFPSWSAFGEFADSMVLACYYACVIGATHLIRRRDREVAAALHASQLARIDAHRKALEADLHVMQARVEPTFLFDALRDIAALYESDHRAGDRLLDQLIQYLRAALPDMRASGSTVAKEVKLLRAYLNILAARSDGRLAVETHVAKDVDDVRMPPMMLLPLVAPPADAPIPPSRRDGSVRVDIRTMDGRLRIAVAATGGMAHAMVDSPAGDDIGRRLAALYGSRAALAIDRHAADRVQLILEIPQ